MRATISTLMLIASLFIVGCTNSTTANAAAGDGHDRRIYFVNDTSDPMEAFYASNVDSDSWEENILGGDVVPPHSRVLIDLDDGTGYCHFDLKAVSANGSVTKRYDYNVCEQRRWRIYDGSDDSLDRELEVINNTPYAMVQLFASNIDSDTWGEDEFGSGVLAPYSSSGTLELDDGDGYCRYDLKAVFEDGEVVERYDANLCEGDYWRISE